MRAWSLRLRGNPSVRVVDLCLETLHAGIQCSDGEAGLALNYDQEGDEQLPSALLNKMSQRLLERVGGDPLLEQTLFQAEEAPTLRAVTVAILNALSAPLCQPERAAELGFAVLAGRLSLTSFWGSGTSLAVVGCGGFLEEAVRLPWLRKVSCLDLNFATPQRSHRYRTYLQQVVDPQRDSKEIVLDDGSGAERILAETDLLWLSGSTLCNDTLALLLQAAGNCRAVVLEGHSARLWPGLLQPHGVHHVVRTPVDLPVAALLRRYAGQLERGHAVIGPGRKSRSASGLRGIRLGPAAGQRIGMPGPAFCRPRRGALGSGGPFGNGYPTTGGNGTAGLLRHLPDPGGSTAPASGLRLPVSRRAASPRPAAAHGPLWPKGYRVGAVLLGRRVRSASAWAVRSTGGSLKVSDSLPIVQA